MQSVLARRLRHSREALQQSMSSGAPFFRRVESIFCPMQINGLQIIRDPFSKKIIELIHDFRSDRQVLRVSNSGSQQIGSLPGVREKTFEMAQIFLRVASAKVHRQLSRVIEIIRQRAKVVQLVRFGIEWPITACERLDKIGGLLPLCFFSIDLQKAAQNLNECSWVTQSLRKWNAQKRPGAKADATRDGVRKSRGGVQGR